jgi:hypothetical protein
VVCTTRDEPVSYDGPFKSKSEAVRLLKAQKVSLEGEKRVRDHESDLLVTYAKTLSGEHVSPTQMGEFLQSFVEQGRKNLQAVAELDEKLVVVNRQIEAELEKEATKKGASTGEVTIVVGADSETHVNLKLTYSAYLSIGLDFSLTPIFAVVSNASWESTYELHASTDNSKPASSVALHYRARILQSTGEDWTDTALTLSTVAASTIAKSIPWLNPIKIKPQSHHPRAQAGGLFNNKGATNNVFGVPGFHANNAPVSGQTAFGQMPQTNVFGQGRPMPFGQQQAPAAGSGLFGQQQAPAAGGGLFGSTQQQQQSLFGQLPQQQQQQQPSIFASSASLPQQSGLFGSTQTQAYPPPQPVPAGDLDPEVEDFEDIAIPGALAGPTTIVTETPLAISYAVEGATTVPSDGTVHQVSVAVLPFEAKISHICTPRVDPRVYLQCHVKNTSEYRLLPGPVSVVLNDSFVSKTSINVRLIFSFPSSC